MELKDLKTPCFVINEADLIKNGEILKKVQERTGCKILMAQKCFSNYKLYPLISNYVAGTEASGLFEARLGYEEMPHKENHVFSAAFKESEFDEILEYVDHVVFNSVNQFRKFYKKAKLKGASVGLRINPEHSTQKGHEIYDPCSSGSRLGVRIDILLNEGKDILEHLDGIHFHTLCEQNSDALKSTLEVIDNRLSHLIKNLKWINFGGGHHITREDYDIKTLEECIMFVKNKYNNIDVYLEPGEAIALNAGDLLTTVLDVQPMKEKDKFQCIIVDTSACCHMPDVLEMPYRPPLKDSGLFNEKKYNYRIGSQTCLAGDVIGDYSFDREIKENDMLVFQDMAIYTMVKTNTFNGMPLPNIYVKKSNGSYELYREFNYFDFKNRL